ncbi:MAG: 2-C-methyl-D-erythritol 4-phosphate cytidylyltransferase [Paludibacteraceae bacterium]|nr:2-C-methyl-D-erythritol 4-phosphate cytidylyltransferase [Paludibacteraceae bacterium]
MNNRKSCIIVAGGKGERMQSNLPKQFIELQGKPILMHTIEAFRNFDTKTEIILVLPATQIDTWQTLCKKHAFSVPHKIVIGGATRFESVKNGLSLLGDTQLVAIHDGVRPLVSVETIAACYHEAAISGAAIPVVDAVDSMRQIVEDTSIAVDRTKYKMVQTPQVFSKEIILKAYNCDFSPRFTDDASVVEASGQKVALVNGNIENIKITTKTDLLLAEAIMQSR